MCKTGNQYMYFFKIDSKLCTKMEGIFKKTKIL